MKLALSFAAILAFVFCSPVMAEVISLAKLIDENLPIEHGDKLFDQFEYYATGDMPPASAVNVATFTDLDGNFGISFTGGFVDLFDGSASDALIRFRVTVLDPSKWISDAYLFGNPVAIGNAIMQVGETFLPEEPNKHLSIYHVNPGNNKKGADSVYFNGLHKVIHVQKDILALALTADSAATLSLIDQSFSQVPEPSAIVTLALGLALVGCFVHRNRR